MRLHRRSPPELPGGVLLRSRLLPALLARFDRRVVVVVAPAGFGKTTLLAQAIHENALAPRGIDGWLSCEPADGAATVLLAGLADGLGADTQAPTVDVVAEAVLARAPLPVALVLDDVHEIAPGTEAAAALAALVAGLPTNGHLVFAGRRDPPVALARLEAAGQVMRVGEADLRLTSDELADLAELNGVGDEDLAATGGWAALAALRVRAGTRSVERFVWEEVLAGLDPELRQALAALVAVDGADPALLRAVVDAPVDVDDLCARVPLLERRGATIRAHALWRQPVEALLDDEGRRAVRRRAAAVLAARGELARAADLVLPAAAHDEEWAVIEDLIADGCTVARWVAHADLLVTWWSALPDGRRGEPAGLLLRASIDRLHQVVGEDTRPVLDRARVAAEAAGKPRVELAVLSQLAHVAWWQDDLAMLVELYGRIVALAGAGLPEAEGPLAIGRAMVAQVAHDHDAMLGEIARVDRSALDPGMAAAVDWLHARALIALGRAEEAIPLADRAVSLPSFAFRAAQSERVFARWFCGRFFEAAALLRELEAAGERLPRDQFLVGIVTAGGNAMLGDLDAARRGLAVAVAALGSVEGRRPRLFLGYTRALIAVAEGDDEAAAAELDATLAGEPIGPEIVDTLRVLLGVVYVLLPERRDELRSLPVGPDQRTAFAVAETFVRSREGVAPDRPVECEQALSVLGLRWTLELACRTDDAMATVLTDRFGPAVRDTLRAWAAEGRTGGSRAAGAATCLRTLPFPPAAAVYLRVLGPTTLERDGDAVRDPDWRRERVRSLLLLLVARRRISREVAATTLWPDLDAEAAGGNLRVTLRYLNKVLEPDRAAGDATWFVRAEGDALRLADEQLGVDAWELEAALDDAAVLDGAGAPSVALSRYEEALALWRGEYMADVYDDWAAAERDRLRSRFLAASVRSGELLLGTGDVDRALVVGTRAVEVEPWSEAAHRLVMAAHLARGDRAGARRALDRCAAALDELGVEPEEATVMLERAILLPQSDG